MRPVPVAHVLRIAALIVATAVAIVVTSSTAAGNALRTALGADAARVARPHPSPYF